MLKTRMIPTVLFKNGIVVKSKKFTEHRNIGSCINVVRVYNAREVDELVFLDITATKEDRKLPIAIVREVLDECFMPLTVGGGVKTVDDINMLLRIGADKVSINSEAVKRPEFISEAAKKFGAQCVVVSIDAKKKDGGYEVFTEGGSKPTGLDPVAWAKKCEELGAGEILINSIDNDGMMDGYDIELTKIVSDAVSIPVIACGGAGSLEDFVKAIKEGHASAVSASSIFLFTQTTPKNVKESMAEAGIDVRL